MVMEVGILDAGGLRALLRERAAQCLLLDCRSFFAFNAGHIAGSVNVRFSTIVRRRAKGSMGLEHIVPNAELRGRLLAGAYHAVVLLDERSTALDGAKRDGTLALAAGALRREARSTQVLFLQGGYEAFSASCPELCSKQSTPMGLSLPLSTSVPDSAESGCSSCSTPLYDQVSRSPDPCRAGSWQSWQRSGRVVPGRIQKSAAALFILEGTRGSLFHHEAVGWSRVAPSCWHRRACWLCPGQWARFFTIILICQQQC